MEQKGKISHPKSIMPKTALILLIAAMVPMMLMGGFFLYRLQVISYDMAIAGLKHKAIREKLKIDFFLQEKLNAVRFLSRNFNPGQYNNESFLYQKLRELQQEYGYSFLNLGVLDQQGHMVAQAGDFTFENSDLKEADWFKAALNNQYAISDVLQASSANPRCIVAASTQTEDSRWILKADIDFSSISSQLKNFGSENREAAFILNRKGEFQTPQPENLAMTIEKYLRCFNKETYTSEFGNSKVILGFALLKNDDWVLIIQQDSDAAFSSMKFTRNVSALILALSVLSILIMALWLSGKMKKFAVQFEAAKNQIDSANDTVNRQIIESGSLASIGELASGIAHEINNPVAIMVEEAGWVQDLIHEGIDKNDNREEFIRALKQIETQGRRCKEITRKLLTFGRKTDSRIENVQLNDLIEEVVSLSLEKARHANVKILTNLDPYLPEIQASVTEMQQVLSNIINNGLDAMENKGDRLDISSTSNEDHIVLTVRDNGPGITAINLNRVFDPFFSTKPVGKGSGLGLSICYGIVKKMGGRINFESVVGEGSAFHIELPLNNAVE